MLHNEAENQVQILETNTCIIYSTGFVSRGLENIILRIMIGWHFEVMQRHIYQFMQVEIYYTLTEWSPIL